MTLMRRVKRLTDVVGAALALLLLSPLIVAAALGTWLTLGRPILFRQVRPGRHGRPFVLVKFRTMRVPGGGDGPRTASAHLVTRFGAFLRRTSIDELPEFWNILKGEMSLVGPRPLLMEYQSRYSAEQARRHEVRPGLTGMAQISGRHLLSWPERFALDVWYVDHWSLALDFRILLSTVKQVLRGKGVAPGASLDYVFTGSEPDRGRDP